MDPTPTKKLRDALDGYINKARKVSGKRSTSRKVGSAVDLKARRHRSEEAVVLQQLRSALAIIQEHQPARITTVGGGCSVSMAPFSYLLQHGEIVIDRSVLDDFLVLNPEHMQTGSSP